VVQKLAAEVNKVLAQEEYSVALANAGMAAAKPGKPEGFDAYFRHDLAQWTAVVKSAGIKPE
jgi:tripartite-type tricarboxylate transporter receptor subunit TctC